MATIEILLVILCIGILSLSVLWNKVLKPGKVAVFAKLTACVLLILLSIFEPETSKFLVAVVVSVLLTTLVGYYRERFKGPARWNKKAES
ncbi:MAG: hypothetical protein OXH01_10885 [Bacteroidetes bacterium]|nr:hypothetical protein [Bacteroidota bacterium]